MLKQSRAFSSIAVKDIQEARKFYGQTLGVEVVDAPEMKGILNLKLAGGVTVMVYPKPDHVAATYTVLNFPVENVEKIVASLKERGVRFEVYRDGPIKTDDRGIASGNGGPRIAWFRDPSGNILSVMEQRR
jgi:catechol 2,3-dioxygenase-like lactoylglutathione lyase family enzyme